MSRLAIHAENVSKKYAIGRAQTRYATLRDSLMEGIRTPFRRMAAFGRSKDAAMTLQKPNGDFIWALKDASFEVMHGEVVGIIGRNGAGKSTLLKVLSRITEPTAGRIVLKGRVGSLLEVGTGFHPELTGRENIYLNGAILGMSRIEIDRKFDEIVAFAETEKFLDTPVKHYSSGMYVRLAFAVAAHLEPEILLVDEVLAVGDAAFQKKCLGKMGDVARQGRTVLFVSHNMRAVQQLCGRSLWIADGKVAMDDLTDKVVFAYLNQSTSDGSLVDIPAMIRSMPYDAAIRIQAVEILQDNLPVIMPGNGAPIVIRVHYDVLEKTRDLRVFFDIVDPDETILIRSFNDEDADEVSVMLPGSYLSQAVVPANLLAPGLVEVRIYATIFNVRMCVPFPGIRIPLSIEATGRVNRAHAVEPFRGKLAPYIEWETTPEQ
jgi:lipopolysaccharide transport system ATP-binding protein